MMEEYDRKQQEEFAAYVLGVEYDTIQAFSGACILMKGITFCIMGSGKE